MTVHAEISARDVVRDRWGHWTHPDYFTSVDGNEFAASDDFSAWLNAHRLKSATSWMENDVDPSQMKRYWKTGNCSDWEPVRPPGEGWFTGSIHDTDDGPVCVWLCPLAEKADE